MEGHWVVRAFGMQDLSVPDRLWRFGVLVICRFLGFRV